MAYVWACYSLNKSIKSKIYVSVSTSRSNGSTVNFNFYFFRSHTFFICMVCRKKHASIKMDISSAKILNLISSDFKWFAWVVFWLVFFCFFFRIWNEIKNLWNKMSQRILSVGLFLVLSQLTIVIFVFAADSTENALTQNELRIRYGQGNSRVNLFILFFQFR